MRSVCGALFGLIATGYVIAAMFALHGHHYDQASSYLLVTIAFTLFENQMSNGGWWSK